MAILGAVSWIPQRQLSQCYDVVCFAKSTMKMYSGAGGVVYLYYSVGDIEIADIAETFFTNSDGNGKVT